MEPATKQVRKNARSTNTYCCTICRNYHQCSRGDKCKNITVALPVFADFLQRYDAQYDGTDMSTEVAIRRILGVLMEHTDVFTAWTHASPDALMSREFRAATTSLPSTPEPVPPPAAVAAAVSSTATTTTTPPELTYAFLVSQPKILLL